jgi:hypothetical protein
MKRGIAALVAALALSLASTSCSSSDPAAGDVHLNHSPSSLTTSDGSPSGPTSHDDPETKGTVSGPGSTAAASPEHHKPSRSQVALHRNWVRVFHEGFDKPAPEGSFLSVYGDKWGAYPEPWHDTTGHGLYSTDRVLSVKDGSLRYRLHTENGQPLVAAPYPSPGAGYLSLRSARVEVRFRADQVDGYKIAWMLWPDGGNPAGGEIDFPEGNLTGEVKAFAHCTGANHATNCLVVETGKPFTPWHTAVTTWFHGRVTFELDGVVVGSTTREVPRGAMHPIFQAETRIRREPPPPGAAGTVYMDEVTIWRHR